MPYQDLARPIYPSQAHLEGMQTPAMDWGVGSARFRDQILSAARLSANPPPQRA
jgi:hypothetical protein